MKIRVMNTTDAKQTIEAWSEPASYKGHRVQQGQRLLLLLRTHLFLLKFQWQSLQQCAALRNTADLGMQLEKSKYDAEKLRDLSPRKTQQTPCSSLLQIWLWRLPNSVLYSSVSELRAANFSFSSVKVVQLCWRTQECAALGQSLWVTGSKKMTSSSSSWTPSSSS